MSARAEYNDNIFLTSEPHDSVYGLVVIPRVNMSIKEQHWDALVDARLRSNNYSDDGIDSNDVNLDLAGNYQDARNIYTFSGQFDKDSNLNVLSSEFGVFGSLVKRRTIGIVPQYTRLLSERLSLSVNYSYSDVEFEDVPNSTFVPYKLESLASSLLYAISSRSQVTVTLQGINYESKDNTREYQLFVTRVGVDHQLSELWSADISLGGSRRNSTNRSTQVFDFFGQPVAVPQEFDFSDKGYVLDAGIAKKHETGTLSARISRDDVTNSTGGLNEVSTVSLYFDDEITELLRYRMNARYEIIDSVSAVQNITDREIMFFETVVSYEIDRNWSVNGSYRYVRRKFTNDISNIAPDSNRIYLGLTYHLPDISTF